MFVSERPNHVPERLRIARNGWGQLWQMRKTVREWFALFGWDMYRESPADGLQAARQTLLPGRHRLPYELWPMLTSDGCISHFARKSTVPKR